MSLGQFFLGLVTLIVATIVYRWQKGIDRETASLAELRQLLSQYATLSKTLFLRQPYIGEEKNAKKLTDFFGISEPEIELYSIRDQIYIMAPDNVVNAVLECDRKFRDWKVAFPQSLEISDDERSKVRKCAYEFRSSHQLMLEVMRREFERHNRISLPKFFHKNWVRVRKYLASKFEVLRGER